MYSTDSVYQIDWQKLFDRGYRGIILDIDNTLVPHGAPADEKSKELIERLKRTGYKLFIVSNNHEQRAKSFADAVYVPYSFDAGKPCKGKIIEAIEAMGLQKKQVIAVGDQIFTDMWGAKNAGIEFILTKPIDTSTDTAFIRVKRVFEIPFKLLQTERI